MAPWAGYIRVSHVGGRAGDRFHSPEDQARMIREKAAELGGGVEVLTPDLDRKGSDPERETLLSAIEGVEQGRYQGIIVAYLSRLSRRTRDTLEMWDRVRAAGGRVIAVQGNIDSAVETPEARLQLTILAAIDEHEHATASERFANLRASSTARGIWQRRQVPRGYVKNPETRKLEPGPDADLVRQAFVARAGRQDMLTIAQTLDMTTSGVRALIRNRVYLGELRVGEHVNLEAHPPLVTPEEWRAAQVKSAPRRKRNLASTFTLTGLVRCASCGHAMSPAKSSRQSAYKCHGRSSAGPCPKPTAISQQRLEGYVEQVALAEFGKLRVSAQEDMTQVDSLRSRVHDAELELSAYLTSVSAVDVGAEAFGEGARSRRETVEAAQAELDRVLSEAPGAPVGDLVDAWDDLPPRLRNRALSGLIEAVVVAPVGAGRNVDLPERTRILASGSGIVAGYTGGGRAMGIRQLDFSDLDQSAVVLR